MMNKKIYTAPAINIELIEGEQLLQTASRVTGEGTIPGDNAPTTTPSVDPNNTSPGGEGMNDAKQFDWDFDF